MENQSFFPIFSFLQYFPYKSYTLEYQLQSVLALKLLQNMTSADLGNSCYFKISCTGCSILPTILLLHKVETSVEFNIIGMSSEFSAIFIDEHSFLTLKKKKKKIQLPANRTRTPRVYSPPLRNTFAHVYQSQPSKGDRGLHTLQQVLINLAR